MKPDGDVIPVLVLGVGNRLLQDDAVGLVLLEALRSAWGRRPGVEFVDGGTQGLALLGLLDGRRAVLVLDAVAKGSAPGSVHCFDPNSDSAPHAATAHESSVGELLAVSRLLGEGPAEVCVVGIEPEVVRTGIGLSPTVHASVDTALHRALDKLLDLADVGVTHA